MLCTSCSRSFDGVARFCSGCGQPITPPVARVHPPLTRHRYGRMIAGVCAGIAQTYGFDVTLVRLLVCALGLCSAGTVLLAYIIAWIVVPVAQPFVPAPTSDIPTGVVAS